MGDAFDVLDIAGIGIGGGFRCKMTPLSDASDEGLGSEVVRGLGRVRTGEPVGLACGLLGELAGDCGRSV